MAKTGRRVHGGPSAYGSCPAVPCCDNLRAAYGGGFRVPLTITGSPCCGDWPAIGLFETEFPASSCIWPGGGVVTTPTPQECTIGSVTWSALELQGRVELNNTGTPIEVTLIFRWSWFTTLLSGQGEWTYVFRNTNCQLGVLDFVSASQTSGAVTIAPQCNVSAELDGIV